MKALLQKILFKKQAYIYNGELDFFQLVGFVEILF